MKIKWATWRQPGASLTLLPFKKDTYVGMNKTYTRHLHIYMKESRVTINMRWQFSNVSTHCSLNFRCYSQSSQIIVPWLRYLLNRWLSSLRPFWKGLAAISKRRRKTRCEYPQELSKNHRRWGRSQETFESRPKITGQMRRNGQGRPQWWRETLQHLPQRWRILEKVLANSKSVEIWPTVERQRWRIVLKSSCGLILEWFLWLVVWNGGDWLSSKKSCSGR